MPFPEEKKEERSVGETLEQAIAQALADDANEAQRDPERAPEDVSVYGSDEFEWYAEVAARVVAPFISEAERRGREEGLHDPRCEGHCINCRGADACSLVGHACVPCRGKCREWAIREAERRGAEKERERIVETLRAEDSTLASSAEFELRNFNGYDGRDSVADARVVLRAAANVVESLPPASEQEGEKVCPTCAGTGDIEYVRSAGGEIMRQRTCPDCNGSGKVPASDRAGEAGSDLNAIPAHLQERQDSVARKRRDRRV